MMKLHYYEMAKYQMRSWARQGGIFASKGVLVAIILMRNAVLPHFWCFVVRSGLRYTGFAVQQVLGMGDLYPVPLDLIDVFDDQVVTSVLSRTTCPVQ